MPDPGPVQRAVMRFGLVRKKFWLTYDIETGRKNESEDRKKLDDDLTGMQAVMVTKSTYQFSSIDTLPDLETHFASIFKMGDQWALLTVDQLTIVGRTKDGKAR